MSVSTLIEASGLGKRYEIEPRHTAQTLKEAISTYCRAALSRDHLTRHRNSIWALRNITFDVREGDVVGLIGNNGAGKTTLLRVLSRITEPTEGRVTLRGRVGTLLEAATGFHPELTGRENIYLAGAIIGMSTREVNRHFDAIVDFSEAGPYLDTPIKRYSTGMVIKLGFSLASHLTPEILILDEVLASVDGRFQEKALQRTQEMAGSTRAILLVSHNLNAISALCNRVLTLNEGQLVYDGTVADGIDRYLAELHRHGDFDLMVRHDRKGDGRIRSQRVRVLGPGGGNPASGEDLHFELDYESPGNAPLRNVSVSFSVSTSLRSFLFMAYNEMVGQQFDELPPRGCIRCKIPRLPLAPGRYEFNVHIEVEATLADWVIRAGHFNVVAGDYYGTGRLPPATHGGVLVQQDWTFSGQT